MGLSPSHKSMWVLAEMLTEPLSVIYHSWLTVLVPVDWNLENVMPVNKKAGRMIWGATGLSASL